MQMGKSFWNWTPGEYNYSIQAEGFSEKTGSFTIDTNPQQVEIVVSQTNSLDKVIENQIRIYPNPVVEQLNIDIPAGYFTSFHVTDLTGKVIISDKIFENQVQKHLKVEALGKGFYLLIIEGNKANYQAKFIVW